MGAIAAIFGTRRVYLDPLYHYTLLFNEAYFAQRNNKYERGGDPNLDEGQAWASKA